MPVFVSDHDDHRRLPRQRGPELRAWAPRREVSRAGRVRALCGRDGGRGRDQHRVLRVAAPVDDTLLFRRAPLERARPARHDRARLRRRFALCAIVGAAWAADVELGMPAALLAAATAAGIGMALFDYRGALARARFLERSYAQIVLFKNAVAFLLMVGGAFLFHSPALVLCGAAASGAAALLVARRALADPQLRPGLAQRGHLRTFAIYAMPLVAANILYQLMPLMNRSALALSADYAEAGKFSLAADLGLRLFMTLGSGLDILLFQIAVRIEAARGRAEAEGQI